VFVKKNLMNTSSVKVIKLLNIRKNILSIRQQKFFLGAHFHASAILRVKETGSFCYHKAADSFLEELQEKLTELEEKISDAEVNSSVTIGLSDYCENESFCAIFGVLRRRES